MSRPRTIPRDPPFKDRAPFFVGFTNGGPMFSVCSHLACDLAEIREGKGGVIEGRFEGFASFVPLDPDKVRKGYTPEPRPLGRGRRFSR
jgi:hypothetical protein